ncbi:MAG: triose-phosphate isomerase [Deltaproteobacteria bacterium]|nr:triose-phosphate isomerase [Deltaproteobacteria bacterium]
MTKALTPLIAGNWKMNKTVPEARALAREIRQGLSPSRGVEVAVAPPYTALAAVADEIAGSPIKLAAQEVFWEKQGAYTGAISPLMLTDVGCHYVIIGHSERRQYFGETDETVNRKVKAALEAGLFPIVCVGETLEQREQGRTFAVVEKQIRQGLAALAPGQGERLVIAYEPVWAIGTGKTATPDQAQEVHKLIRGLLPEVAGAADLRILYGGSVTPDNAGELMGQPDINGALVGGASLKAASFLGIINAAG